MHSLGSEFKSGRMTPESIPWAPKQLLIIEFPKRDRFLESMGLLTEEVFLRKCLNKVRVMGQGKLTKVMTQVLLTYLFQKGWEELLSPQSYT